MNYERKVLFVRNLQRHGKGFFAINEWGAGPDYHLNPSMVSEPAARACVHASANLARVVVFASAFQPICSYALIKPLTRSPIFAL